MNQTWVFPASVAALVAGGALLAGVMPARAGLLPQAQDPAVERRISAPQETVWQAALKVMAPLGLSRQDRGRGFLASDWVETIGAKTQGLLTRSPSRRRSRYRVALQPDGQATRLIVRALVEERSPGGSRAFRWERAKPDEQQLARVADLVEAQVVDPEPAGAVEHRHE
ncbi:MAG: hypothetical protein HYZ92_00740 [Candidatus Omnitrophica bacterium]|nr:hypothetical protein [Candidatus Omnitrophota bacterium]